MSGSQKSLVESFFYRIFGDPLKRREILIHWHSLETLHKKYTRLADFFEEFIYTILYEPISFHMYADRFQVFGDKLPIRYEWLSQEDQTTLISMFANRKALFVVCKEFENNQFDCNTFTFEGEKQLINHIWRRQIVRDFVWIVATKNISHVVLELIVALQQVLLSKKSDVFVSAIHDAIQGRMRLTDVIAWDHSEFDVHPEILFYSKITKGV